MGRSLKLGFILCLAWLCMTGCYGNPVYYFDRVVVRAGLDFERFTQVMADLKVKGYSMVEKRRYVFTATGRLIISRTPEEPPQHVDLGKDHQVVAAGMIRYQMSEDPFKLTTIEIDNDSPSFCTPAEQLEAVAKFISTIGGGRWHVGLQLSEHGAENCARQVR